MTIMKASSQRRLNRYASTLLIGGIFLCCCGLLFLTLCGSIDRTTKLPDHTTAHREHSLWPDIFSSELKKTAFIVVLVLCRPQSLDRRDTIRQTWLSNVPSDVAKYFAIGTRGLSPEAIAHLNLENSLHDDLLLIADLEDDYLRLTDKVVKSFSWLDHNVDYKFVLKADDDTFARVDMLYDSLSMLYRGETTLYWGFFVGNARVHRRGIWAENDWVLCDRYLPYARGGGYVLSASLVHYIVLNSRVLKYYKNEDVSVGAWLGPLNVKRIHDPRFDTEYKSRGCHDQYIVTHKQTLSAMREKFDNLRTSGHLCSQEVRLEKSYIYNWKVAPSVCCIRNDSSIP